MAAVTEEVEALVADDLALQLNSKVHVSGMTITVQHSRVVDVQQIKESKADKLHALQTSTLPRHQRLRIAERGGSAGSGRPEPAAGTRSYLANAPRPAST